MFCVLKAVKHTYYACSFAALTRQCFTPNISVVKLFGGYRDVADGLIEYTVLAMVGISVCNSKMSLNK